jgi:hypothetical protein
MRAYLQRSEVRLSTMHRVAVGFLSGAGLLFLFPVFLKDGVLSIINELLSYSFDIPDSAGTTGKIATIVIYICLVYPFLLSLAIPITALMLLVRDIMRFYFVGHPPGFSQEHFNPRFALTGVAFSTDESEELKSKILLYEYGTDLINFVISHADAQAKYYGNVIDKPKRLIVPYTRRLPRLIEHGVVENITGKPLDQLEDDDPIRVYGRYLSGEDEEQVLDKPYVDRTLKDIDRFNAALGLAGFLDRALYQEVAKTEVSLVRHSIKLRKLVLRYFQALIILLWTGLITFLMLPFLQDEQNRFPILVVFAIGYFIWALLTPFIVQLPVYWLVNYSAKEIRSTGLRLLKRSDGLQNFGRITQLSCYIAVATSGLAIILEIWLQSL